MKHYTLLSDLHRDNGWRMPEHPLLGMVRCVHNCALGNGEFTSDFYMIVFKRLRPGIERYGRTKYDHQNGTMLFVRPGQLMAMKDLELEVDGFVIFFHEDYLIGHSLYREIKHYNYFEYVANEALHLAPGEEKVIWDLHDKIHREYHNNEDEYSRAIILSHISSILTYSQRFYKRQFINRTNLAGKTVSKFNQVLTQYLNSDLPINDGLPTVQNIAAQLHLSPRYLSDLLKQETGKTAIELIHLSLVAEARQLLTSTDLSVAEIAYQLGFESLSYFSRLFKQEVGLSPLKFKKQDLN